MLITADQDDTFRARDEEEWSERGRRGLVRRPFSLKCTQRAFGLNHVRMQVLKSADDRVT